MSRHWKRGLHNKQTSHQNVARQVGMTLEEETESRVWAANEQSMKIVGTAKAQVKIEHATKICNFWVTPSMSDRVILSRLELMNFHNIPKSFASIMKSSEGGAQMCQSCARIIRLNHFEELGKNHFVSVVNKRAPGGHVSSKEMYQSVLREACDPCRKLFVAHHCRSLPCANKNMIVTAIATELALHPTTG